MKINVGILFGGKSVEHDISIITALQIYENIDKNKYNVIPLYLNHNNEIYTGKKYFDLETYKKPIKDKPYILTFYNGTHILQSLTQKFKKRVKIDVIFSSVHGMGTEDGTLAGYLEFIGIPYTSPSILGSSICQDKAYTKEVLKSINVNCLEYIVINDENKMNLLSLTKNLTYPKIIKPAHLGSSIGISVVNNQEQLIKEIQKALVYDNKIIIETFLENFKEYNIAVYKRKNNYLTSSIEIISKENTIFDFDEKYINHHKDMKHQILQNENLIKQIEEIAVKAYQHLELSGVVRFDFIEKDQLYLNEINTIPGALANYLFKDKNLSFSVLIDEQIKQAIYIYNKRRRLIKTFNSSVLTNTNKIVKK
jgi:D-alanine-D-alanine ligase